MARWYTITVTSTCIAVFQAVTSVNEGLCGEQVAHCSPKAGCMLRSLQQLAKVETSIYDKNAEYKFKQV